MDGATKARLIQARWEVLVKHLPTSQNTSSIDVVRDVNSLMRATRDQLPELKEFLPPLLTEDGELSALGVCPISSGELRAIAEGALAAIRAAFAGP